LPAYAATSRISCPLYCWPFFPSTLNINDLTSGYFILDMHCTTCSIRL
jgi:hypothetical protein